VWRRAGKGETRRTSITAQIENESQSSTCTLPSRRRRRFPGSLTRTLDLQPCRETSVEARTDLHHLKAATAGIHAPPKAGTSSARTYPHVRADGFLVVSGLTSVEYGETHAHKEGKPYPALPSDARELYCNNYGQ
jgi:hypothetical protein